MQMNKNQITMLVIGGVAVFIALVLGFFVYAQGDAQYKARRTITGKTNLYNNNKHATAEQQTALEANAAAAEKWSRIAYRAIAGQNERLYSGNMTAESLVQKMQSARSQYAQREVDAPQLPGVAEKPKFIGPEFMFGSYFQPYLNGDPIPADRKEEVQRRWGDVCQLADILLAGGALSLDGVEVIVQEKPTTTTSTRKTAEAEAPDAYPILEETYKLTFKATPAALVAIINTIVETKRFISIDQMSFAQAGDPLLAKFGAGTKSEASSRRRSRRSAEKAAEETEEKKKTGLITDPEQELVPFTVTMTLSTLTATAPIPEEPAQEEVE